MSRIRVANAEFRGMDEAPLLPRLPDAYDPKRSADLIEAYRNLTLEERAFNMVVRQWQDHPEWGAPPPPAPPWQ